MVNNISRDAPRARRGVSAFFLLAVVFIFVILLSAGMGYIRIFPTQVLKIILAKVLNLPDFMKGLDKVFPYVIWEVRLPRILTAAIVGCGLSISGVVFQGILLNPLADPYTLGVSAGAAFGASIALLLEIPFLGIYAVPLFAFIGSLLTLLFVLSISSFEGRIASNNLILSGIIVATILSAGISFIKYVADEQVSVIIFWLLGSFNSRTWIDVFLTFGMVTLGGLFCLYLARDLNVMALGDKVAMSLGVHTNRTRTALLIAASFIAAVCVAVSGIIGFVGLVIPHLMRFVVGSDNRILIPTSALLGGILLLFADTVTRAVLPQEIPIGVLTAIIGGPVFCYIFRKNRRRMIHG
jgi:iron complex transport system permease protein